MLRYMARSSRGETCSWRFSISPKYFVVPKPQRRAISSKGRSVSASSAFAASMRTRIRYRMGDVPYTCLNAREKWLSPIEQACASIGTVSASP